MNNSNNLCDGFLIIGIDDDLTPLTRGETSILPNNFYRGKINIIKNNHEII